MLKNLIILLFLCLPNILNAQINELDSLKNELNKTTSDSIKVINYCLLSDIYSNFRPDSAFIFANQGLEIAKYNDDTKGQSRCLTRIGNIYKAKGNYPKALENHLLSLKLSETIKDEIGIAAAYNNMAEVYKEQEDYKRALEYYAKTKNAFLKLIKELESSQDIINPQVHFKKIKTNKYFLAITYLNIGDAYERMNLLDSALTYQTDAYNAAIENDEKSIIGAILCNLGVVYFRKNLFKEALFHYNQSVPYLKEEDDKQFLSLTLTGLGDTYKEVKKYDSAILFARNSIAVAQSGNFQKEVYNAAILLSKLFEIKKNPDSAFHYQKIATLIKDSMFTNEKNRKIEDLKFNEQIRQEELAAIKIKKEKDRVDNLQYIAITIFIISFLVALYVIKNRKTKSKFVEYFGVIGLLLAFEFIALFIHPYIANWTHHTPIYMLIILVGVAAILSPLHHKLTHIIKKKVEAKKIATSIKEPKKKNTEKMSSNKTHTRKIAKKKK